MTKLLDEAVEAAHNVPPDARDNIAHVVMRLTGADDADGGRASGDHRPESRRRPWRICDRRGSARGLSQILTVRLRYTRPALVDLSAILDYIAAHSAGCATCAGPHQSSHRSSVAASQHGHSHERSGDPPDDDDALPVSGFLRGHGNRDHHSCRAARGPSSVGDARFRLNLSTYHHARQRVESGAGEYS